MASEQSCETAPQQCANGCGFYGCPENRNLCSMCYRQLRLDELKRQLYEAASISFLVEPSTALLHDVNNDGRGLHSERQSSTKDHCFCCNKRVGLAKGFKCRCGNMYCRVHRYPEEHHCNFDFKAAGRELISKSNPIVKADKLHRI